MEDLFVFNDKIIVYTFDSYQKIDPNYKYFKAPDFYDPYQEKARKYYKENYYIVVSSEAKTLFKCPKDPFLIAKDNLTQDTIKDIELKGVVQLEGKWKIYYLGGGSNSNYYISTPEQFKQINFNTNEYTGYFVHYPAVVIRDPWRGFIKC